MPASPATVSGWAYAAGWRYLDLAVAIAVAYSETGANTGHAGGVWNVPGGPADGSANAAAAYKRWQAGGWRQWPTYANGKYLLFMPIATPAAAAAEALLTSPAGAVATNVPGGDLVSAAQNALTLGIKTQAWVANRHNWARVAEVIVGGALLIGALVMVSKPVWKPAYETGQRIAAKVATRGA